MWSHFIPDQQRHIFGHIGNMLNFLSGILANLSLFNETFPFHLSWWKWVAISYFLGFLGLLWNVDIWLHNKLQLPMYKEWLYLLSFAATWKPITNKTSCMIIDHLNSSNLLHFFNGFIENIKIWIKVMNNIEIIYIGAINYIKFKGIIDYLKSV